MAPRLAIAETRRDEKGRVLTLLVVCGREQLQRMTDPELDEIWDPSAIAHTGNVLNADLETWAAAGWRVDDRFELRRVVDYGLDAGSDVLLIRRNQLLEAIDVPGFVVGFKVPSSGCSIHRLVGSIDSAATDSRPFFARYDTELRQQLTGGFDTPAVCQP